MANLEIQVLVGKESKEFLADLTTQLDRMEKLSGKAAVTVRDADTEEKDEIEPKRARKAKTTSFDDSEEAENMDGDNSEESDTEEDAASFSDDTAKEEMTKPTKKAKTPKLTSDDVNEACKARALRSTRAEVLSILKKKFNVKSITELDPTEYAEVIKVMIGK